MRTITHEVLDLHYTPDECQGCYEGTYSECMEFASTQTPHFMYKVVPLIREEMDARELLKTNH
jgi:hypothetical protein